MLVTVILTSGARPSIVSGVAISSALFKLVGKGMPPWMFLLALGVIIVALGILYPVATPLAAIMQIIVVVDNVYRTVILTPKKMSYARYFLLANIGTILWGILSK